MHKLDTSFAEFNDSLKDSHSQVSASKVARLAEAATSAAKRSAEGAPAVARRVHRQLLECKPHQRLGSLYVLDLILRNELKEHTSQGDTPPFARAFEPLATSLAGVLKGFKGKEGQQVEKVLRKWIEKSVFSPATLRNLVGDLNLNESLGSLLPTVAPAPVGEVKLLDLSKPRTVGSSAPVASAPLPAPAPATAAPATVPAVAANRGGWGKFAGGAAAAPVAPPPVAAAQLPPMPMRGVPRGLEYRGPPPTSQPAPVPPMHAYNHHHHHHQAPPAGPPQPAPLHHQGPPPKRSRWE